MMSHVAVGSVVLGFAFALSAIADVNYWQSATLDGRWDDATRWSLKKVPALGEQIRFSGSAGATVTIPVAGTEPVQSLSMNLYGNGALCFRGEGDSPSTLAFTNTETYLSSGCIRFENVDVDFRRNNNRTILGTSDNQTANFYAYCTLGAGASLLLDDIGCNSMLISGDDHPGVRFEMEAGSRLDSSNIYIGRGSRSWGAFVQRGGAFMPSGFNICGNDSSFGAYEMFDGTNTFGRTANLAIQTGTQGAFYQHGGLLRVGTFNSGNRGRAEVFVDGGRFEVTGQANVLIRDSDTYGQDVPVVMTIAKAGTVLLAQTPSMSTYAGRSRVQFNLNDGGVLALKGGFERSSCNSYAGVMFNGGVIERYSSLATGATNTQLMKNIDAVLYAGGAKVRCWNLDRTAPQPIQLDEFQLRPAGGWGVKSVAVTSGGAKYLMPPLVTISGGSGSNATAIAQIDYVSETVTNVVVTCPGEGYAETDVLTVTFEAPTSDLSKPTAAAATVTLAENGKGGLEVLDGTALTLTKKLDVPGGVTMSSGSSLTANGGLKAGDDVTVDGEGSLVVKNGLDVDGDLILTGSGKLTLEGTVNVTGSIVAPHAQVTLPSSATVGGTITAGTLDLGGLKADGPVTKLENGLKIGGIDMSETIVTATTAASSLGALTLGPSTVWFDPTAALGFASYAREAGSILHWNDALATKPTFEVEPTAALYGDAKVLAGALAANAKGETTGDVVAWDAANKTFKTVSVADAGDAVLSVASGTVTLTGATAVPSGLVIGGDVAGKKLAGGSVTTGNGQDLIIHEQYVATSRRDGNTPGFEIASQVVDADGKHTALVLSGYKDRTSSTMSGNRKVQFKPGPYVNLTNGENSYSGGTYINDCAVLVTRDSCLGAVPAAPETNIFVSGFSQLKGPKVSDGVLNLHANRGLHLARHAILQFSNRNSGNYTDIAEQTHAVVNGPITGFGLIVPGEWTGSGSRSLVELNGDLTDFEGWLACMGNFRVPDASKLGAKTSIGFWGVNALATEAANIGDAIFESSGLIEKTTGSKPGNVYWGKLTDLEPDSVGRDAGGSGNGGFAAYGGPLTVSLKSPDGSRLKWSSTAGLGSLNRLKLQNESSAYPLTWTSDLDIYSALTPANDNATRTLQVGRTNPDAEVYWPANLVNTSNGMLTLVGRGTLWFTENAQVGSTVRLYTKSTQLGAFTDGMVTVNGLLDYSANTYASSGFTMKSSAGTGVCALNAANVLHGVRVASGTLEVNGTSTATNLTVEVEGVLAGSGGLTVNGPAVIDGAIRANAGAVSSLLTVNGDVAFGEDATVFPADASLLDKTVVVPVMTWTGTATGRPKADMRSPKNWQPVVSGNTLSYVYVRRGFALIFR